MSPESGHAKYLYMGQLSSGEAAVGYLTRAIAIMEREMEERGREERGREERGREAAAMMEGDVTNDEISAAYCALAEIYLTDSW